MCRVRASGALLQSRATAGSSAVAELSGKTSLIHARLSLTVRQRDSKRAAEKMTKRLKRGSIFQPGPGALTFPGAWREGELIDDPLRLMAGKGQAFLREDKQRQPRRKVTLPPLKWRALGAGDNGAGGARGT